MQEILDATQVKVSKQLAIMKQLGLLKSHREGTWMIYSLTQPVNGLIQANLNHLLAAQCAECNQLQKDLITREKIVTALAKSGSDCPKSDAQIIPKHVSAHNPRHHSPHTPASLDLVRYDNAALRKHHKSDTPLQAAAQTE